MGSDWLASEGRGSIVWRQKQQEVTDGYRIPERDVVLRPDKHGEAAGQRRPGGRLPRGPVAGLLHARGPHDPHFDGALDRRRRDVALPGHASHLFRQRVRRRPDIRRLADSQHLQMDIRADRRGAGEVPRLRQLPRGREAGPGHGQRGRLHGHVARQRVHVGAREAAPGARRLGRACDRAGRRRDTHADGREAGRTRQGGVGHALHGRRRLVGATRHSHSRDPGAFVQRAADPFARRRQGAGRDADGGGELLRLALGGRRRNVERAWRRRRSTAGAAAPST